MQSRICISDLETCGDEEATQEFISQYRGIFPLPFANLYGVCNNYSAARFLENQETECAQTVENLETDCLSKLNPLFFTSRLAVQSGMSKSQNNQWPQVATLYSFDPTTRSYTEEDPTTLASSVYDSS